MLSIPQHRHPARQPLVLAGILSSLIALRFGAPCCWCSCCSACWPARAARAASNSTVYALPIPVGSIALALILFDGGLRTRLATFRNVLAPATTLATVGVLITTLLTAPVAKLALNISWMQALLVGAVVASTDAAAVFLLINARGLRLRPRVRRDAGSRIRHQRSVRGLSHLAAGGVPAGRGPRLGACAGHLPARCGAGLRHRLYRRLDHHLVLNRVDLPQGLHAPFVAVSALVVFAAANTAHSSGFLAVYLAGLVVGNRQTRAHNSVVVFLDAVTWLAQIVMFVLLGLLVWPQRIGDSLSVPSLSRSC